MVATGENSPDTQSARAGFRPAVLLGFALGGFFDGILLHQILQWHHLLSLVSGVGSLREQVLWDGAFHALMYFVAAAGLLGLWRARAAVGAAPWQALAGALLIGFAAWHIVDAVLSHWLLGIHRIRTDSPDPLFWDLLWFGAFGLLPALVGWWLARRPPPPGGRRGSAAPTLLALALVTMGLGAGSLRPAPAEGGFTTIAFAPWVSGREAVAAIAAADGRLVWADPGFGVVVASVPEGKRLGLHAAGALLVSGGGLPAGCLGWSRPPAGA